MKRYQSLPASLSLVEGVSKSGNHYTAVLLEFDDFSKMVFDYQLVSAVSAVILRSTLSNLDNNIKEVNK